MPVTSRARERWARAGPSTLTNFNLTVTALVVNVTVTNTGAPDS